jgi:prepilin-type N-terminal cleavage/methylation domain-containing protein
MKRFNQTMSVRCCRQLLTDRRGFTIGEILIAVAVFSILAAIAVPQFAAFRPKLRLDGATRQIYSELMWARSKAVNDNSSYVVTFPTNQTMLITGLTTKTVNIQTEYADVTLASSALTVTFSPRGTADVAPTITLTNSGGTKAVTLKITGTASIN